MSRDKRRKDDLEIDLDALAADAEQIQSELQREIDLESLLGTPMAQPRGIQLLAPEPISNDSFARNAPPPPIDGAVGGRAKALLPSEDDRDFGFLRNAPLPTEVTASDSVVSLGERPDQPLEVFRELVPDATFAGTALAIPFAAQDDELEVDIQIDLGEEACRPMQLDDSGCPSEGLARHEADALDLCTELVSYSARLEPIEGALAALRKARRWTPLVPLLETLARHRDAFLSPFDGRNALAAEALDRFFFGEGALLELVLGIGAEAQPACEEAKRILRASKARWITKALDLLVVAREPGLLEPACRFLSIEPSLSLHAALQRLDEEGLGWLEARNLLVLLGRLGGSEDIPAVARLGAHPDKVVRRAVLDTLVDLGGQAAGGALVAALGDPTPTVQRRAAELLGKIGATKQVSMLLLDPFAQDDPPEDQEPVLIAFIDALAELGNVPMPRGAGSAEQVLVRALARSRPSGDLARMRHSKQGVVWSHPEVGRALCAALGRIGEQDAERTLSPMARDDEDPLQREAQDALSQIARRRA